MGAGGTIEGVFYTLVLGNEEYYFNDAETAQRAYNRILSVSDTVAVTYDNMKRAKEQGDGAMFGYFAKSARRQIEDLERYLMQFCGLSVRLVQPVWAFCRVLCDVDAVLPRLVGAGNTVVLVNI